MKRNKRYTSFEELDRDLMLLDLQADICKEEIRLASQKTKNAFQPGQMIQSFFSGYVRRTLTEKAIDLGLNVVRTFLYRR
ncbi:MAG TPA: DUF6327 family protein [Flavobacteriaceae bacterium]|nr:DUF6327 family protein [Flavobacteriaceae bacterium]